jgi:hypothetical protein
MAPTPTHPPTTPQRPAPLPPAQVRELVAAAARTLLDAVAQPLPADRFARAHLAALRTTAALLAARARPVRRRGPGLRSAWSLLAEVAPELSDWAAYFAAGAGKRAAAEAGLADAVAAREADDLVRGVEGFLALVASELGLPAPVVGDQLVLAG